MYSVGIRAALGKVCALDAVCRVVEQVGFLGKHPPLLTVVLLHTPSYISSPPSLGKNVVGILPERRHW